MSTYTVKRILSHKVVEGGQFLYETAWKHGGEHTWESIERFTYTVLSRYWNAFHKAAEKTLYVQAKAQEKAEKATAIAEAKATAAAAKAAKRDAIRLAKAQEAAAAATELAARRAAVAAMNDHQLIAEFIRLFDKKELPCTHCNGETHVINWVHSIRKRAMRNGLVADMKLPKTCDDQQARNMISNPVNNPAYYRLRDTERLSPQDNAFALLVQQRKDGLAAVGIAAKPYKYVPTLSST